MKQNLFDKLLAYDEKGIYPCHMPGHKRQLGDENYIDYSKMDITEIEGFDNLHHPEEIILEEEKRAAKLYGAKKTFFLVNGSTSGNVSAILACVRKRGTILVARNCHKSVYNAIYLNECNVEYLTPEIIEEYSIVGGITKESVQKALEKNKDIQAVLITSPTYDGIISDISGIADVVHRFHIPLIVDEAHGAHFGLEDSLPRNAIQNGADVVIHSLHKTLPSFTQTAVIHVQGDIVDYERLSRFQSMYQSTSPSYLLLASMSRCFSIIEKQGMEKIKQMNSYLDNFYKAVSECRQLKIMDSSVQGKKGVYEFDRTKIIISTINTYISGEELYRYLLDDYKIQMEMTGLDYCQAIMTFMDTKEGFERLAKAILEIDEKLEKNMLKKRSIEEKKELPYENIYHREMLPKRKYTIFEAMEREWKSVQLEKANQAIAADYVMLYPPGIPLIAPGEIIEEKHIAMIKEICNRNMNLIGVTDKKIKVVV